MSRETATVTNRFGQLPPEEVILGTSAAMREVRDMLKRIAHCEVPILVRGEAGTGKEILARLIHKRYPGEIIPFHKVGPAGRVGWRRSASFVAQPGAAKDRPWFSAVPGRPGCIGTLFFEDVAELNSASQRTLVQMLHDAYPPSLGPSEFASPLFRVICSTRHDIEREMRCGHFREDLFYSINIISLHLPPLRARRDDIPCLARYYWARYREESGSDTPEPPAHFLDVLQAQRWPGNIRELAGVMKRYVLLGCGEKIIDELTAGSGRRPLRSVKVPRNVTLKKLARWQVREVEREIIFKTLRETQWNRTRAARALNISYRTLLYKIKAAGVPPKNIVVKRERLH